MKKKFHCIIEYYDSIVNIRYSSIECEVLKDKILDCFTGFGINYLMSGIYEIKGIYYLGNNLLDITFLKKLNMNG